MEKTGTMMQSATAITNHPPARPLTLGASRMPTPPAFAPALYASHSTTKNATVVTPIINDSLDFKRPFMTPPTNTASNSKSVHSNHRDGKCLGQLLQIQSQRQPVLMPQHAAAVRDFTRRFFHQQRL